MCLVTYRSLHCNNHTAEYAESILIVVPFLQRIPAKFSLAASAFRKNISSCILGLEHYNDNGRLD